MSFSSHWEETGLGSGSDVKKSYVCTATERGRRGEEAAAAFLIGRGYEVLARNQRTPFGELDLVCREGSCLVVVEVKARGSSMYGAALEAIGWQKARRLRSAAAWWLGRHERRFIPVRFDVVVVALDERGCPCSARHVKDFLGE